MAWGDIDHNDGGGFVGSQKHTSPPQDVTAQNGVSVLVSPTKFKISVTGLRPTTLHMFYLIDKDVTSDCVPLSGISIEQTKSYLNEFYAKGIYDSTDLTRIRTQYGFGSSLISDPNGKLEFYYFFNPLNAPYESKEINSSEYTTNYTASRGIYSKIPLSSQRIYIRSTDGFSKAESSIQVKQ